MGSAGSVEVKRQLEINRQIEKQLKMDSEAELTFLKLLLLGAGDAGKSTIMKQIRYLHAEGFSDDDLKRQAVQVYANTIESMISILKAMCSLGVNFHDSSLKKDAELIISVVQDKHRELTPNLAQSLKRLWDDAGVQECFARRNEYQIHDSAKYFLDALDRLAKAGYVPTVDDVLHTRAFTIGITEMHFEWKKTKFKVIDVGGQRSQRRKWIHFFDDTDAIWYLASLSEYDQVLLEDGRTVPCFCNVDASKRFRFEVISKAKHRSLLSDAYRLPLKILLDTNAQQLVEICAKALVPFVRDSFEGSKPPRFVQEDNDSKPVKAGQQNRMQESLRLFATVCNSQWFHKTSIILFFNKVDLFKEKLLTSSLTIAFPDYKGDQTFEASLACIVQAYMKVNKHDAKTIYHHVTCATDTSQVDTVFNACFHMIIQQNMRQIGVM